MRRCVWSVVAAARVDSLITPPRPFRPSSPSPSYCPFSSIPAVVLPIISYSYPMPTKEKGKKVPKIQNPVRKSSSMNASTEKPEALPWLPRNSSSSSYLSRFSSLPPIFQMQPLLSSPLISVPPFLYRVRGPSDYASSPFYNALENARTRVRLSS